MKRQNGIVISFVHKIGAGYIRPLLEGQHPDDLLPAHGASNKLRIQVGDIWFHASSLPVDMDGLPEGCEVTFLTVRGRKRGKVQAAGVLPVLIDDDEGRPTRQTILTGGLTRG